MYKYHALPLIVSIISGGKCEFLPYDTSLYIKVDSPEEASQTINQDLVSIYAWAEKWLVSLNHPKYLQTTIVASFNIISDTI